MAARTHKYGRPEIVAPAAVPEVSEPLAEEIPAPVRRRYRARADFHVAVGDTILHFHKGRRFSTDEFQYNPDVMEPIDE